jgi:hypothetical protein
MDKKAAGSPIPQSVTLASRAKDTWDAAKPSGSDVGSDIKEYGFRNDQLAQDMMLKNIRASAAISDLMANDDIIGAHHPEDVAMHFNEISNIAPDASTNSSIMRPLLRKRLEGGNAAIDPTDVQQMLDIENVRSNTSGLRKDVMSRSPAPRAKGKSDDKK